MRTSHREIRRRIDEEKSKVSDEEFFASREYRAYLSDITEAATRRYNRPIHVTVYADHDDGTVAYTDFSGIFINACNEITWSMPTRRLRSLSIEGLNAHENSHNLFTDNRIWQAFFKKTEKGKFYPKMPDGLDAVQKSHAQEILDALTDTSDDVPKTVIMNAIHAISNILEDGYVDARYSYEFPGSPARGIALNNVRLIELAPDIQTMINKKQYDHLIVLNMLIQYVRAGEVNNLSGYTGEFLDKLAEFVPIVDGCLYDEDARSRCEAANFILICLWPMMQRCFDALRDRKRQAQNPQQTQNQQPNQNQSQSQGGGSEAQNQGGTSSQQDSDAANAAGKKAVEEELSGQMPKTAPNFQVKTSACPSDESFVPDKNQQNAIRAQIQQVLAEETDRIAAHVTSGITGGEDTGCVTANNEYEGNGYEHAASDIERLLESMAERIVDEKLEEELSEELQKEAESIQYGNAHRGIHITVNRMSRVDQRLIDAYNTVAPPLLQLSKRLQRSVNAVLRDKRQGGKQTGLYVGKRLNQHALHRDDGRIFCNTRLPTEPINLAVGLLIDESGSMCGNDRITRARATAIVVQDFCEKLGIPCMITGHTAWSSHVELFSYAEFDSVDRKDRYRLMDLSARDCNRDGAALRFVAEKLYRHPSEVKLLIIICDGQPNDSGYTGTAAEADLRGIKLEYGRKGVQIYAAAIGDDRDRIERIYGTGFLDITDLNQLPILLTQLISRNIPN